MKNKKRKRHLLEYIKVLVFLWLKKHSQKEGSFVIAVRQLGM